MIEAKAQSNSMPILNLSKPQPSCNIKVNPRQFLPRFSDNELDSYPIRCQGIVNWKCSTQALHFLSDCDNRACSLDFRLDEEVKESWLLNTDIFKYRYSLNGN